ncbi:hypothetical protein [Pelobium manganitolerans]|uniref:hypothetical protein n=1 Tax=Pelobium manganitolerans TaxID=1842495 RepID=UPI003FA368EF
MLSQLYPAEALTLNVLKFALGICGSDEEVKALPLKANGAGESFLFTFLRKKSKCQCPARGQKRP